jgi:hypothetical protein
MQSGSHISAAPPPWYRQLWPWLLMAPPIAAVLGGIATVVLAVVSFDGMVADQAYPRPLTIREERVPGTAMQGNPKLRNRTP